MLEAGRTHDLCFHPISGNDRTVILGTEELLRYVDACAHVPVVVDFAQAVGAEDD